MPTKPELAAERAQDETDEGSGWMTGRALARTPGRMSTMQFFREITEYVSFEPEDALRVRTSRQAVEDHFDAVVDAFYEALWKNPRTKMVFEGPEQVERLRATLGRWLDELFTGPYDLEYLKQRYQIGRMHVQVGLLPHFMFGAMNVVRRELTGRILRAEGLGDIDSRFEMSASVEKLLDLELTIMVQSYWDTMMDLKLKIPSALAMGMAHEIRNPLNAVNLNITLLERRLRQSGAEVEGVTPVLDVMRSELRRVHGLTSEIMDFSKPVPVRQAWIDPQAFLDDLEAMHGPTLDAAGITFELESTTGYRIWADPDRLRQVLVNLITNAVEALDTGGTIRVELGGDEESTRIEVSDDGEGMPPGSRYQIFDLFYTTKPSGTGMGLPIVGKIIEAHEGFLDVQSRPGAGTTFILMLPRPSLQEAPR
jgi:signal transduction histidine kinase